MADIDGIRTGLQDMSDDDLMSLLKTVRQDRRTRKSSPNPQKTAKKPKSDGPSVGVQIESLSAEAKQALLKKLLEGKA